MHRAKNSMNTEKKITYNSSGLGGFKQPSHFTSIYSVIISMFSFHKASKKKMK